VLFTVDVVPYYTDLLYYISFYVVFNRIDHGNWQKRQDTSRCFLYPWLWCSAISCAQ